jgi:hypothetical protein
VEGITGSITSFGLATPLVFWAGSVVFLLFLFVPGLKKKTGLAIDLGFWRSKVALRDKGRWLFSTLVALTTLLMTVIAAGPQVTVKKTDTIYGKPVMVVIDVSGSMEYKGLAGKEALTAREKARMVLNNLLSRGLEANLGLLIYSTENYVARTFTYKESLFKDTLENDAEINFISTGTRTAEALAKARTFLLKNEATQDKAIILVSDLETDLEAVMQMGEEVDRDVIAGIRVYTILTDGEDSLQKKSSTSQQGVEGMTMIGMNDTAGIDEICTQINAMQSSPIRTEESLVRVSLVPYLVPLAIGLILLCLALSETKYRRIP